MPVLDGHNPNWKNIKILRNKGKPAHKVESQKKKSGKWNSILIQENKHKK